MANVTAVQILEDGSRNTIAKVDMTLDTSDLANTVVIDPAVQYQDKLWKATKYRIDRIDFVVEDGLAVDLLWDATTPVSIVRLIGRGKYPVGEMYGGLQNNAGAGVTGKILMATQGWTTGAILHGSFILQGVKQ